MPTQVTAAAMREQASALLGPLDDGQRELAGHAFADDTMRRWIEYRPRPRPGVSIGDLDPPTRKAAHRLLATALSAPAYAQAMTIVALEEVLDRAEGWSRGRHSNDYWVIVFGDPDGDDRWGWRFEGHHLSVTMTLDGDRVYPTPIFLGANPARVTHAGRTVVGPLAAEEDLARALLDAMTPAVRATAITSGRAPADILSAQRPRAQHELAPLGVPGDRLGLSARALLDQLTALYLDRLPPELARQEAERVDVREVHFAWEGPAVPGSGHYYRIQGPDLLIEYDNTQNDANHAHTVLRRPDSDFGGDVLAAHHAESGTGHHDGT
jgi:Protein of unknown function (DUF3500)